MIDDNAACGGPAARGHQTKVCCEPQWVRQSVAFSIAQSRVLARVRAPVVSAAARRSTARASLRPRSGAPGRCAEPRAGSSRAGRGAPATNPRRPRRARQPEPRGPWRPARVCRASRDRARPRGRHDTRATPPGRPTTRAAVLTLGCCVWCTRTPIFHDRTRHCHVPTACGRPRSRITS